MIMIGHNGVSRSVHCDQCVSYLDVSFDGN